MEIRNPDPRFWSGKKVWVTGHTGFKGTWLCLLLNCFGARVYGYALEPPTVPSLFNLCSMESITMTTTGDIRNLPLLTEAMKKTEPDIVIHLAAQPLVRLSYEDPVGTYSVNVMGTVNLLEACRQVKSVRAILNVTTDKCYENKDTDRAFSEEDPMGGYDPYSNSKGCSELVTAAYRNSFFNPEKYAMHGTAVATARAGNVIGGGDWAADRLIPDFIKAIQHKQQIVLRNPGAIRPWQHVLEPLTGYLLLAEDLFQKGPEFGEGWNFGPDDREVQTVEWMVKYLCEAWSKVCGEEASYSIDGSPQPHEAAFLKLDSSKAKERLDWSPRWTPAKALDHIVTFTRAFLQDEDLREVCFRQIQEYLENK